MATTELTRVERDRQRTRERQVRSYHRAFSGELTLYNFGNDLRPWRPIAARQIYWTAGLLVSAFVFARVWGLSLPIWSMEWFIYYFVIPGGVGWLFTRAVIEGRYLHVVIVSWLRHALYGQHLTGGYQKVVRQRPMKKRKVRIQTAYHPHQPLPILFKLAAGLIVLILAIVAIGASRHPTVRRLAPVSHLTPYQPALAPIVSRGVRVRRIRYPHGVRRARTHRHAAARPTPARRAAAARHRTRTAAPVRVVSAPPQATRVSVTRYVAPPAPVVTRTSQAVASSTATSQAPATSTHRSPTSSAPSPDKAPSTPNPRPDKAH